MKAQDVHSLPYMPQLDGLRAIAVLAVLLHHYAPASFVVTHLNIGEQGVRLFFVLSGFLITTILLRDFANAPSFSAVYLSFIKRRTLRLYPVLLVSLIAGATLNISKVRETLLWSLTYTVNILVAITDQWPDAVSHLWTLANEEQFYLLWPAVLFFTPRRYIPALLIGTAFLGLAYRCSFYFKGADVPLASAVLPPAVFDSLALGCLLAVAAKRVAVRAGVIGVAIWVAAKASELSGLFGPTWAGIAQETCFTAGSAAFVWLVARAANGFEGLTGKLLSLPSLVYIGTISYGIYVVHLFVIFALGEPISWWLKLTGLAVTFGLAALSWQLLEKPIMRRRPRMNQPQAAE